ncbi:uncharacterized protein C8A04DRAFT_38897 [Dichotomopilus funicola]|uniref:Uncharacterized protein n=1 Tax=Dichotomopilus funicola TaxID=1934379 RepID=A0AAN6ZJN6_9PEZI|nr:hypothetical protein C8A04DRAFT_38897 [Dichotomopilus funicola]
MPASDTHDLLPGARDDTGLEPDNHGVTAILDVVQRLAAADVPSCVVGVRALRYYGAGREWDLCIPDSMLDTAREVIISTDDGKYQAARPPPPVPWSRRHVFSCFRLKGYNFWVLLVPSSDCFVDPSLTEHVEKSRNGVPYASMIQFARSLLLQQLTADLADFIDGMDLDVDWGGRNVGFAGLQEESVKFNALRNERVITDGGNRSGFCYPMDLGELWRRKASKEAKEKRVEPMKKGRYLTSWRRINSEDPRTRDRPV